MTNTNRLYLRAALRIRDTFVRPRDPPSPFDLPHTAWETTASTLARWRQVRRRSWPKAEQVCEGRLQDELCYLINQLQILRSDLVRRERRFPPPCARAILEDLRALEDEFAEVTIDLGESGLTVVTESITLEGIELGSFAIALDWNKLQGSHPYRVIAQEPNPAASNEEITHPHVSNGHLCEGEAHQAIRMALDQGRLFDFFVIVRQVLTTYNPDSPYVRLENWTGVPCTDCGDLTGDDYDDCANCRATMCEHCSTSCYSCSDRYCDSCLESCTGCENQFCSGCLRSCESCSTTICLECLNEEEVCQECLDRQAEEETTEPAVHADGVGQADLSS